MQDWNDIDIIIDDEPDAITTIDNIEKDPEGWEKWAVERLDVRFDVRNYGVVYNVSATLRGESTATGTLTVEKSPERPSSEREGQAK